MFQTMDCVIGHYVCQSYSASNTTKRKKMYDFLQPTTWDYFYDKHILGEHPAI
jgi:hypothetical protein